MKIHFFHTNDVHSHFEEYLQVATQLRRSREEVEAAGETVFTFDIGDHADRKRMETEGTFGRTNASLLELVKYDACTIGNNEGLTLPRETWGDYINESQTPTLVANLFDDQTREAFSFFEPYIILERDGVRLAVLGLTVPFFDFYKMFGIYAEHPRDTFARLMPEIKKHDVDLVVLLSHLGLVSDRQIAEEIEGIDIILGGHTHNVLHEPERIGKTIICQAGCYGAFYGHLTIDWDAEKREVVGISGGAVARDEQVTPDQDLASLLTHWQEHAAQELTEVVAELEDTVEHAIMGNSPLGHLLTDAMRRQTGAQIAMINAGSFNHGLLQGKVTKADMLTCFPGPHIICVTELTGEQVLSLLRKSLDPFHVQQIGRGYGFRGYYVGGLQLSGLHVNVVIGEDGYELDVTCDGQPLVADQVYQVAATDYLHFSPVYPEFKQGTHIRFELPFLREVLGQELARTRGVNIEGERWHFVDDYEEEEVAGE